MVKLTPRNEEPIKVLNKLPFGIKVIDSITVPWGAHQAPKLITQ